MNLRLKDDIVRYNLINHLYNLLSGEVLIGLKDIIGIDTAISLSPAGKDAHNLTTSRNIRFRLFWMPDNNPISVQLPDYFLSDFLNELSGRSNSHGLTPSGLALIEYISLKIISKKLTPEVSSRLRWGGIIEDDTQDNGLIIVFKVNFMKEVYFFSISFHEGVVQDLIKMLEREGSSQRFSDVVISVKPVLAEGEIKAGELIGIQPGDVIVFREPYIKIYENGSIGGVIMFKTGEDEFIGGYNLDKNEFSHNSGMKEEKKDQEKSVEESIQNIPITLSIELARIKVAFKDLQKLVPGQLLDIVGKNDTDVLISANGKIIGTGRLINIEDTVCVEVLTLKD